MIKYTTSPRTQDGLTLVELMIAMAIGLFIVGAAAALYVKTRSGFDYTNEIARMQETARFAMAVIGHDIREASYNGCGTNSKTINIVSGAATDPFLNMETPVIGYSSGYPSSMKAGSATPVTDAIILMGGNSTREVVVKSHAAPVITVDNNDLKAGEIAMATDCSKASIFQVSARSATTVSHATGSSPGNCKQTLNLKCTETTSAETATLAPGSLLMPVFSNAYFVATSAGDSTTTSLWAMQLSGTTDGTPVARELLVGVKEMHITYGLDTNADGKVDAVDKSAADVGANWNQVATVTIELTIAPKNSHLFFTKDKPTDSGNGYKRFRETIGVRNRTM